MLMIAKRGSKPFGSDPAPLIWGLGAYARGERYTGKERQDPGAGLGRGATRVLI